MIAERLRCSGKPSDGEVFLQPLSHEYSELSQTTHGSRSRSAIPTDQPQPGLTRQKHYVAYNKGWKRRIGIRKLHERETAEQSMSRNAG